VFTWSNSHNVYLMSNKAAFDACNFDGSTLIGKDSGVKHMVMGNIGDIHYFACKVSGHCNEGQKLAVTIGTAAAAEKFAADAAAAPKTPSLAVRVSGPKHVCMCASIYRAGV